MALAAVWRTGVGAFFPSELRAGFFAETPARAYQITESSSAKSRGVFRPARCHPSEGPSPSARRGAVIPWQTEQVPTSVQTSTKRHPASLLKIFQALASGTASNVQSGSRVRTISRPTRRAHPISERMRVHSYLSIQMLTPIISIKARLEGPFGQKDADKAIGLSIENRREKQGAATSG